MLRTQGRLVVATQPLTCPPTHDAPPTPPPSVLGARCPEGPRLMKEGRQHFRPRILRKHCPRKARPITRCSLAQWALHTGCGVTFVRHAESCWAV